MRYGRKKKEGEEGIWTTEKFTLNYFSNLECLGVNCQEFCYRKYYQVITDINDIEDITLWKISVKLIFQLPL